MINRPSHSSAPDPTHPIEVAILGPLEVRQVGALVKLPGERHGALLVDLVLEPGRRVSTELLVDHLWGASPPPSATKTLQKYVSELRRALGTSVDGFLATEGHGYALRLPPDAVDAHRFESMVADARALAGAAAVEQLEAAEALWRGPALDGFAELDHVRPTAQRLEESRLASVERRLGLVLDLREHAEALPELEQLTLEHPLREEMWASLMVAHARGGHRDEALAAYHRARLHLAEELGIEPSARLRDIERQVLSGEIDAVWTSRTARRTALGMSGTVSLAVADRARRFGPYPVSTFIGRTRLLDQLVAQLADARLVTLTGAGGSGKTRVAIEAMRRHGEAVDGRSWFVDLSTIEGSDRVPRATAAAVELHDQPGADASTSLAEALGSRPSLLVLDNCEHVLDGAAELVGELLTSCAGLRVLATSREPLGIPGEYNRPVPPLELPDAAERTGDTDLERYEAVALFAARAREADPSFRVDGRNRAAVVDVCTRLDGMPLALELAAAQVWGLSVHEIAEHIDDRLATLGSGVGRPRRQRTLRATIDWSYELLTSQERWTFERLSVFPGTFDLAAATAVTTGEADQRVDITAVPALVAGLVRQSMLVRSSESGRARYRLLHTLRSYGRHNLVERGDELGCRRRHANHFADLVDGKGEAAPVLSEAWHRSVGREQHNLRSALAFCIEREPDLGAHIADAVCPFWTRTDQVVGGLALVARLLAADPGPTPRAQLRCCAAELRSEHGDALLAVDDAESALNEFERIRDEAGAHRARFALGRAIANGGDHERAVGLMERSLRWFSTNDLHRWASGVLALAIARLNKGELDRATAALRGLLEWAQGRDEGFIAAKCSWLLGAAARQQGRLVEARERCELALVTFGAIDDRSAVAHVQMTLGDIARLGDDRDAARALYAQAFAALTDIGDRRCTASVMKNIGDLERAVDPQHSAALYLDCLERRHALGDRAGAAEALEGIAESIVDAEHAIASATLLGHAESLRSATGAVPPEAERAALEVLEQELAELLTESEMARARSIGARLHFDETVEPARGVVDRR